MLYVHLITFLAIGRLVNTLSIQGIIDNLQLGWAVKWTDTLFDPNPSLEILGTCRSRTTPTGQCGLQLSQQDSDDFVAGISPGYFGTANAAVMSLACAKCVNVTAVTGPNVGASAVVAILDNIVEAQNPQIDLPYNAFLALGGSPVPGSSTEAQGNMQVRMALTPCPDAITQAMKAAPWLYNNNESNAFFIT